MPISVPNFAYKTLVRKQVDIILPVPNPSFVFSTNQTWQGYGTIKGTVKKLGENYKSAPICVFKRATKELLWEVKSKLDGTYVFKNIAVGLECFVVAFDPSGQYNAVISDRVVAK